MVSNGTSGAIVWALRHHSKTGGFYFHTDTLETYRWPGFPSGAGWQETEKLNTIRSYAFAIRGFPVPQREVPPAPVLLPLTSPSSISWRGSAGAETYDIERATSESGPWTTVATNVSDSMTSGGVYYNPFEPFNDISAVSGQAYFFRMKARNVAGDSPPSNVSVTGFAQLVDEMNDFGKMSTYTGKLALDDSSASFFNGDTSRLTRSPQPGEGQFVVYQPPGDLVSFLVDTYFWPYEPTIHFKFYTSPDGASYTELSPLVDEVGGDWIRIQYRPTSVPAGARFLKIEFRNTTGNHWTPQISRLTIDYRGTPPGGPLTPTVTMTAASNVTTTSATLNGLANPNGSPTTVVMQWGTTTAYGNTAPAQSPGSGTTNVPVAADIGGLTPNTTYHYRIVASNGAGTTNGADTTFSTLPIPGGCGTLTVTVHGGGTVTSGDGRINCPTACSATYAAGTSVTLTAVPRSGRSFAGWGGGCGGAATTCALTLNANQSVTATFSGAPFTDGSGRNSEITGGSTVIKAVHVIELRAAIDDVRAANGLPAFSWTDPTLLVTSTSVRREHLLELRTALAAVCSLMPGKCTAYTDATLTPGQTIIKAAHLNELRANVRALE